MVRFHSSSKLRGDYSGMCEELMKEYNRLGRPLAGDEWLEPEALVPLAKRWMLQHATRDEAGRIVMPPRVKHPGKMWIMTNAPQPTDETTTPAQTFAPVAPAAVPAPPSPAPSTPDAVNKGLPMQDDFKIIYRDGNHRLAQINFLGKRVGDVPLPQGSNFRIIQHEGKQVLSGKCGTEIYDCEEYMQTLMPSRSAETKTSGREQGS